MFQSVSQRFEPIKVRKSKKSITVPDMSFTPREIIQKFSRGEKVPLGFNGLYDFEDNPEDDRYQSEPLNELLDNPTRDPDFDRFDYVEEKHALDERNKEREKIKRSSKEGAQSSKRKARYEELSASDATSSETTSGDDATPPTAQ